MRSVLPVNTMAIAMGLHARCGNEDTIWGRKGEKITSVAAGRAAGPDRRRARPRGRHGKEARDIYRIGESYASADETLAKLGYAPNRQPGQVGFTHHAYRRTVSTTRERGDPHPRPSPTTSDGHRAPSTPAAQSDHGADIRNGSPAPSERPGSSRGSSSHSPSGCCCRTTCPGRCSAPSSPS